MLKYAHYSEVKELMKPGDIIAFSGVKIIDEFIKSATKSQISHVGLVLKTNDLKDKKFKGGDVNKIIEVRPQVIVNDLEERLKNSNDKAWWLQIRESLRREIRLKRLYHFALKQQGKVFQPLQAAKSQIDIFDKSSNQFLKDITYNAENYSEVFCSQFVASVLKESGIIKDMNTSEATPSNICTLDIYNDNYYQIKGEFETIKGYNSISPSSFK